MPPDRDPSTEPEALLARLDLEEHLENPHIKQRFVTTMFDAVARTYDRFTRAFSYGMDRGWKRELVNILASKAPRDGFVVDLACGTGDLAFAAAAYVPDSRAVGVDVSRRMLAAADARRKAQDVTRVRFVTGDMLHIAARDQAADVVTVGYGIRNTPDFGAALDEIVRVLKPGGLLLTLDFYRPANPVWRALFLGYLRVAGSVFGLLWHRQAVVYGYIGPSIRHFISWQEMSAALEARGFVVEQVRRKLLGGICIHVAHKNGRYPSSPSA
jgi:demethylmenaquinone methyltransferase/2-methoxy-6-polyprenyl-1,4-benzoquinol methylase